jgi:YggT family protein
MLLSAVLDLYVLAVIAYAVFSWLPPENRRNRFYEFLARIVEPLLRPVRNLLPPMGGWDLSPIVVIVLLELLGRALLRYVPV